MCDWEEGLSFFPYFFTNLANNNYTLTAKEVNNIAVHHGGKAGKAGKKLASNSSSKSEKSKAGTMLANHKATKH